MNTRTDAKKFDLPKPRLLPESPSGIDEVKSWTVLFSPCLIQSVVFNGYGKSLLGKDGIGRAEKRDARDQRPRPLS